MESWKPGLPRAPVSPTATTREPPRPATSGGADTSAVTGGGAPRRAWLDSGAPAGRGSARAAQDKGADCWDGPLPPQAPVRNPPATQPPSPRPPKHRGRRRHRHRKTAPPPATARLVPLGLLPPARAPARLAELRRHSSCPHYFTLARANICSHILLCKSVPPFH